MSLAVNMALLVALTIALLACGVFIYSFDICADTIRSWVSARESFQQPKCPAEPHKILPSSAQAADLSRSADKLNCLSIEAKRSRHSHLPNTSCTFCRQLSRSTVVGS